MTSCKAFEVLSGNMMKHCFVSRFLNVLGDFVS